MLVSINRPLANLFIAPELFFDLLFFALSFGIFFAHHRLAGGRDDWLIKWGRGVFAPLHPLNTSAVSAKSNLEVYPCRLALRLLINGLGSGHIQDRVK